MIELRLQYQLCFGLHWQTAEFCRQATLLFWCSISFLSIHHRLKQFLTMDENGTRKKRRRRTKKSNVGLFGSIGYVIIKWSINDLYVCKRDPDPPRNRSFQLYYDGPLGLRDYIKNVVSINTHIHHLAIYWLNAILCLNQCFQCLLKLNPIK